MTSPRQVAELAAALATTPVAIDAGHALMTEAPDALLHALRAAIVG